MSNVEIVFAANDDYLPYLAVTINSIISYADSSRIYSIHILYTNMSEYNITRILAMAKGQIAIEFIDVSDMVAGRNYYGGVRADTKHISEETFYRLLIPELFSDRERMLYLDCDLVTLEDVSELYDTDLEGKTIGAVSSAVYWNEKRQDQFPDEAHEWFNAGILLWDIKKWIAKEYTKKCDEVGGQRKLETGDQELLQIVCYKDVKYLDYEWNFLWHHTADEQFLLKGDAAKAYGEVSRHPKIVHYSGRIKPWHAPEIQFAEYFWAEARKTVFYEQILYANLNEKTDIDLFGKYIFPFDQVPREKSIVLYGAGAVGKIFKRQIELLGWYRVIAWVDKNFDSSQGRKLKLTDPEKIRILPFDKLVIAVEKENTAISIRDQLIHMDICDEKIFWADPMVR